MKVPGCACPGEDADVESIYSKQPKLSRNTVGCYNAGSVQGNTDCAVSKQLFLQQPASLQSTDHYPLYRKHLRKYDVQFRKLIRRIVGPPPGTNWSAQWHDILHEGNMRVDHWARASGISSWSEKCMIQYWNWGSYIANLPAERWVRRALAWKSEERGEKKIHFQQIVPVGAHYKFGTQNWKYSAGTRL